MADRPALRDRISEALIESLDRCPRCKTCDAQLDAVMAVLAAEPPSLAEVRLAQAVAALTRLSIGEPVTADGVPADLTAALRELGAYREIAAGALETIRLIGELPEARGEGRPAADEAPLIPDGTYVHVAVKGFLEVEGYLSTGTWLGDPATVVLRDAGGGFVALVPRGSVHLITAVPEPGSEPDQPDPWARPGDEPEDGEPPF